MGFTSTHCYRIDQDNSGLLGTLKLGSGVGVGAVLTSYLQQRHSCSGGSCLLCSYMFNKAKDKTGRQPLYAKLAADYETFWWTFFVLGGGGVSSEPREPPLATALSKFHEYMHGAQSVASFLKTPHRRRKHGGNGGNCPRTLATTGAVPPYKIQL